MIYSVWQPDKHVYKYYQDNLGIADDGPTPTIRSKTKLGCAPCDASWKLPPNAIYKGIGPDAKGVVIHPGGSNFSLGGFEMGDALTPIALVGLTYLAFKYIW